MFITHTVYDQRRTRTLTLIVFFLNFPIKIETLVLVEIFANHILNFNKNEKKLVNKSPIHFRGLLSVWSLELYQGKMVFSAC
jgi:hypothetical protein